MASSASKKIALISQYASPGFTIFRKKLINKLVAEGHDVYCFAVDYNADNKQQIKAMGATPISYKLCPTGLNPFSDILSIFQLARLLKKIGPDAVLGFFSKPSLYSPLAARLAGAPRITSLIEGLGSPYIARSQSDRSFKKWLLRQIHYRLAGLCLLFCHQVIFLNEDDKNVLVGKRPRLNRKSSILGPIGVDLNKFSFTPPLKKQGLEFLFLGRLIREKGIIEFVKAAEILQKRYTGLRFRIIGSLNNANPSALSVAEHEQILASKAVIYDGEVKDVREALIATDALVLPSYREGFPMVIQEAMAIGRAIICTDVPGCKHAVTAGKNGLLCAPYCEVSLTQSLETIIQSPELVISFGYTSRVIAEASFDDAIQTDKLIALMQLR